MAQQKCEKPEQQSLFKKGAKKDKKAGQRALSIVSSAMKDMMDEHGRKGLTDVLSYHAQEHYFICDDEGTYLAAMVRMQVMDLNFIMNLATGSMEDFQHDAEIMMDDELRQAVNDIYEEIFNDVISKKTAR